MMKTTSMGALKCIGFAAVLLSALQAHAETPADRSYETYRCVVLGDNSACHPPTLPASLNRIAPGPYARYLMTVDGMDEADALAAARSIGEEPTRQPTMAHAPQPVVPGSYARYLMTVDGMDEADALAAAHAIGEEPTRQPTTAQASGADSHPE
jgi:hypothetical protein